MSCKESLSTVSGSGEALNQGDSGGPITVCQVATDSLAYTWTVCSCGHSHRGSNAPCRFRIPLNSAWTTLYNRTHCHLLVGLLSPFWGGCCWIGCNWGRIGVGSAPFVTCNCSTETRTIFNQVENVEQTEPHMIQRSTQKYLIASISVYSYQPKVLLLVLVGLDWVVRVK